MKKNNSLEWSLFDLLLMSVILTTFIGLIIKEIN